MERSEQTRSCARTVLVVDDDDAIREALGEILADEGYQVASAANGRDALGQLERGLEPCVILLDLMMPVMNGWEFRHTQKSEGALAEIPVLVISAAADAMNEGFSDAAGKLRKPIDLGELLAAVGRVCTCAEG